MGVFNDELESLMGHTQKLPIPKNGKECPPCCSLITSSNNQYYSNIIVPKEFQERILVHVVSHYIQQNVFFMPPLYLVIEGPAGEGKTSQTIATLTQHDIDVLYVSAAQLSGAHERESVDLLDSIYEYAIFRYERNHCISLLIDDFHMGAVNHDPKIEKTINSNLLTGRMMNLADRSDGKKIPIILTGNDFSNVYGPLLRSGRADKYKWNPDFDTKTIIIRSIIMSFSNLKDPEFDLFCNRFRNGTIADFAQLKNDFRKDYVWRLIEKEQFLNMKAVDRINKQKIPFTPLSYGELCVLAEKRIRPSDDMRRDLHD